MSSSVDHRRSLCGILHQIVYCCRTRPLAKFILLHVASIRFRQHFLLYTSTFNWSLPQALVASSGNGQKCNNMAQLGNCIARLHHITGVGRMTRMVWMSGKTMRTRMVILPTGIISSLWKLRLCILLRGRGHKYLLLDVHDHVYKKN